MFSLIFAVIAGVASVYYFDDPSARGTVMDDFLPIQWGTAKS